jgi:hyaluronoglucosaminidase
VAISDADASKARAIFRQPLLIWDNYYVNDQSRGFLALGPLTRHDPGLERFVVGDTADPLVQPEAAKIGLFTLADWSWNPAAYGPTRSWEASLDEFAGRDPRTVAALRVFADANYGSGLNPVQAPSLSTAISTFWSGWKAGDPAAVTRLKSVLIRVGAAPGLLRRRLAAPEFLQETAPWLDATQAWSKAATISVDLLVARRNGLDTRAKADDAAISQLVAVARSSLSLGTPVQVAAGVLDKFVAAARADRG